MVSQQIKAGLITAIMVTVLILVAIYTWFFFASRNNDSLANDGNPYNIQRLKGASEEIDNRKVAIGETNDNSDEAATNTHTYQQTNTNIHTETVKEKKVVTNIDNVVEVQDVDTDTISIFNDVNTTRANSGDVLAYNGDQWVPATSGENTDNQFLSISGNKLSIERGNQIDLPILKYTEGNGINFKRDTEIQINSPTCNGTDKLSWNGSAFICSPDLGSTMTAGNGITITNDEVSLANTTVTAGTYGNTTTVPQITVDGTGRITNVQQVTITNNDTLNSLNCNSGEIAKYDGLNWNCAVDSGGSGSSTFLALTDTPGTFTPNQIVAVNAAGTALEYTTPTAVGTDNQNLTSATINASNILTITIEDGNPVNVDLTNLINDADFDPTNEIQNLSLVGDNLTITNNAGATTINLNPYLDNTDNQQIDTFILSADVLTLEMENDGQPAQTVNLSAYLDNTDTQAISRTGNTISITGNASTVDLTTYINTDTLDSLSCSGGEIAKWDGMDWTCDTDNAYLGGYNLNFDLMGSELSIDDDDGTLYVDLAGMSNSYWMNDENYTTQDDLWNLENDISMWGVSTFDNDAGYITYMDDDYLNSVTLNQWGPGDFELEFQMEQGNVHSVDLSDLVHKGDTGGIFFADHTNIPTEDSANFFWDQNQYRLGIGTNSPDAQVSIFNNMEPAQILIENDGDTVGELPGIQMYAYDDGSDKNIEIVSSRSDGYKGALLIARPNSELLTIAGEAYNGEDFERNVAIDFLNGPHYALGDEEGVMTFSVKDGVTLTEAMRINYDGNIGIGTSIPAVALDINNGSLSVGSSLTNTGSNSVAFGMDTTVTGNASIAGGSGSSATGDTSVSLGYYNDAQGSFSTALGYVSTAEAVGTNAIGAGVIAKGSYETALGRYNTEYVPVSTNGAWAANDRLLVIGNGSHGGARSDAMIILNSGETSFYNDVSVDGKLSTTGFIHVGSAAVAPDMGDIRWTGTDFEGRTGSGWESFTQQDGTGTDSQTLSFASPNISISGGNSVDISGIDTNTTYTAGGTLLNLIGTTFSLNEGTLTDGRLCTYVLGTGMVCDTDSTNWDTAYGWGDHSVAGYLTDAPSDGNTYGRNNGAWTMMAATTPADNDGAIQYNNGGSFGGDANSFSWDDTNDRLGIGTDTPNAKLSIFGTDNSLRLSYDGSNYADLSVNSSGELLINATSATESAMVIGSGVAQDTSIQFDGNAHDFFSGIDQATGAYVIGSGLNVTSSAVETGPGTVTNSAGGTTITGTNTKFTSTFRVGNQITIGADTVTISAIASDTSMTTGSVTSANTNATYLYNAGTAVTVEPSGNFGIGTDNPLYALDVRTTGSSTVIARFNNDSTNTSCTLTANGGTLNCSSDERLKKNIATVQGGLETLMKLNPKTYNWKTEDENVLPTYGFIAQEVKEILPQLVRTDEETGYLQLSTIGMIPVITQAVQDQNSLITTNTNDLSLKASATTVTELQTLIDNELDTTSDILNQVQSDMIKVQSDVSDVNAMALAAQALANTNANLIDDVENRITDVETIHTELMNFFISINPDTLVYTDENGDLTVDGIMTVETLKAGSIVITGEEIDATLGESEIAIDAIDVFVQTEAAQENSRIFVTPKGGVVTQTMSVSSIDVDNGFNVTVAEPVAEILKFDWFIVDDEVIKNDE